MLILRYIINLFIGVLFYTAMTCYVLANDPLPNHTTRKPLASICPTTCYVGIDLAKICVGWHQKTGPVYEINGSIDFSRILLEGDYGWGEIQRDKRKNKGSFSLSKGKYFRVGLNYNFIAPALYHNQFFIGCRYAKSFFDFQLMSDKLGCKHPPGDPCRQLCSAPIALRSQQGGATAHWWELVAGGKVYLISILSIGCTVRYKFKKAMENDLDVLPFDIPGFGLAEFDHAFGCSIYLLGRIPLQKAYKKDETKYGQKNVT